MSARKLADSELMQRVAEDDEAAIDEPVHPLRRSGVPDGLPDVALFF